MIRAATVAIDTTGPAGSATGESVFKLPASGELVEVAIEYHASAPNTTDVTIAADIAGTILTRTNTATSASFRPRVPVHDATGQELTAYDRVLLAAGEILTVTVAGCDELSPAASVTFKLRVLYGRRDSVRGDVSIV